MRVIFVLSNPVAWYKQPASELIRLSDESPGSHMAIILESHSGSYIYEAVWPKVRKIQLAEWMKHNAIAESYYFSVPEHLESKLYFWLEDILGTKYSLGQLVLNFFANSFYLFNKLTKKTEINGKTKLICCELGVRLADAFIQIEIKEAFDKITLKDVRKTLIKLKRDGVVWK